MFENMFENKKNIYLEKKKIKSCHEILGLIHNAGKASEFNDDFLFSNIFSMHGAIAALRGLTLSSLLVCLFL